MQNDKSKFKETFKKLLRDSKHAKLEQVEWFLKELEEIGKIFASSILTLKGKK